MGDRKTQVLVIGSGAGGATTAAVLAAAGLSVTVVEEGGRFPVSAYGKSSVEAMPRLYRRRGMTPIMGSTPIGFVEGRCVGGSTEINSGFWHRTPRETLLRWKTQFGLDVTPEELEPHFQWAEEQLHVSLYGRPWPKGTELFAKGAEKLGWSSQEVPRASNHCQGTNACAHGCPTAAKQGMTQGLLPLAEKAGAVVLPNCTVKLLLRSRGRVTGVLAELRRDGGPTELVRIDADAVVVCGGPTQTPLLLRRSGYRRRVGATLCVHPMLKVAARFPFEVNADRNVLPLLQVKEFWPECSFGGAFFTPGHLALTLSDNWQQSRDEMNSVPFMGSYYVAVRGSGDGSVRSGFLSDSGGATYELSKADIHHLSQGMARLCELLFAAGATHLYPTVQGLGAIRSETEAARWLDEDLPKGTLSLSTVHAFSTCPAGENEERTAVDSFGKLRGADNLWVNDASILPDSPGVNPQGSVMALARRNALRMAETIR